MRVGLRGSTFRSALTSSRRLCNSLLAIWPSANCLPRKQTMSTAMSWGHARVTGVWRMCFEDKKRLTNNPLLVLSFHYHRGTAAGAPLPTHRRCTSNGSRAQEMGTPSPGHHLRHGSYHAVRPHGEDRVEVRLLRSELCSEIFLMCSRHRSSPCRPLLFIPTKGK